MQNRRDFLKLLGLAVGASLSGCGGGNESSVFTGSFASPNAYQFVPLITSGSTLPNQASILAQAAVEEDPAFVGSVLINDRRRVYFHANDNSDRTGVYRVEYDDSGQFTPVQSIVREGDTLPDGTVVDDISPGALNNLDDAVFVIEDVVGKKTLQFSKDGGPFEPLCDSYTTLSSEARLFGDLHSDTTLTDNGDMMFCCNYQSAESAAEGQGLFYIPQESVSGTKRVLSRNELVPGTASGIRSFGGFDIRPGGEYVVQGCASLVEAAEDNSEEEIFTYLLRGRVDEAPELLAASPGLGSQSAVQGAIYAGVRLSGQSTGFLVQPNDDRTELWVGSHKLLEADLVGGSSLTPRGSKILGIYPPVFGPNGLMLVEVCTAESDEILVYNGQGFSTILATGDMVGSKTVDHIIFGATQHSINSHGEFACVVEYTDGQSAVLVGLPV